MTAPAPTPERRRVGFWASAERQANTVFLFFLNPVLDQDNSRLSGTRILAWIIVWADTFDILHGHSIQELRLRSPSAPPMDPLDWHNVACYALAFLIWFGPKGMDWGVELVKAWRAK